MNPFPGDKLLDCSNLKVVADDISKQNLMIVCGSIIMVIAILIYIDVKRVHTITIDQPERHVDMIRLANNIRKHSRTVMVAILNDAYLPLAYSWLCNTKEMGIHNKVLFITTDEQTSLQLKREWPEVNVANMNMSYLRGDRKFGQAGYIRVNVRRHQYIYQLLKEGFEILHFEVDCVWLKNPLLYLESHKGFDLVVNIASDPREYNSGFVYIFNTKRSIRVWEMLAKNMTDLARRISSLEDNKRVRMKQNDQQYWSDIVRNRVPGINIKVLKLNMFADGQWYDMSEANRSATDPYIIHNNYIIGKENKIKRAKKWNHWFIDDNMKCKMDLVHKVVKSS